MTSTFTPNLGLNLQATGDNPNAWGTVLNVSVFSLIDTAMGSNLSISVAGNTNVVPSSSQALNFSHYLTGALTGNIFYILPATGRFYVINNATTGAFTVEVITSAGGSTGVIIPQGTRAEIFSDGTNVYYASDVFASSLVNWAVAGGTADAITATLDWLPSALVNGMVAYVRAGAANATTTPTFSPNGLTPHTITKFGGVALLAGDIAGAGHELILRLNLPATRWELCNPITQQLTDAMNGGLLISNNQISLEPSDLLTKTTPTAADSVLIQDAAASNAAKTALISALSEYSLAIITSTQTFTTAADSSTSTIYEAIVVAPGGGGGGAAATNNAAGGGGGAGETRIGTFTGVAASTGITCTINASGSGGSATGGNGGNGGTATIATPVNFVANGGQGGGGSPGGNPGNGGAGGSGGSGGTGIPGGGGGSGVPFSTTGYGGIGGSSVLGGGGPGLLGAQANGSAPGSGASGGGFDGAGGVAGGIGAGGWIIIRRLTK